VAGALLALIGDAVTQLAPPYLVKIAIDQYIAQGDLAGLNNIALVYLAVLIASFSLEYAQTYMMQMIGQRIMFDMRMQIYAHLQAARFVVLRSQSCRRLMTRVTTDVDVINDLFTSGVVAAFGDLFMLVGIMATLLWMDWRLALIGFSCCRSSSYWRNGSDGTCASPTGRSACGSPHQRVLNEHINGMATVQLFRREDVNYGRFELINREHRDANVEQIFFYAVFLPAVEFVAAIATALILWFGGGSSCAARSRWGRWSRSSSTRAASSGRSATCRRSSTRFRLRWRPRNGSFSCSIPKPPSQARRQRGSPREKGTSSSRTYRLRTRATIMC
jgi:ATP-binding cassette subfamily B protein